MTENQLKLLCSFKKLMSFNIPAFVVNMKHKKEEVPFVKPRCKIEMTVRSSCIMHDVLTVTDDQLKLYVHLNRLGTRWSYNC